MEMYNCDTIGSTEKPSLGFSQASGSVRSDKNFLHLLSSGIINNTREPSLCTVRFGLRVGWTLQRRKHSTQLRER